MPNALIVGFDKQPILQHIPQDDFLLIDDGPLIDALPVRARRFDIGKHRFNPLKDMDDRKAASFIAVLDGAFPEGANTLTRRYSNHYLFKQLLNNPRRLDRLTAPSKDPYERDAHEKIERLLLSPVLENVLNGPDLFRFEGKIAARLDRAKIGDFAAFVLGNLLIAQAQGTVIVPDFGFYALPSHVELIRQGRLVAGINSFDELPGMRNHLIQMERKIPSRTTLDDAELFARLNGVPKIPEEPYRNYLERCIGTS